jgi:hypothetical protein
MNRLDQKQRDLAYLNEWQDYCTQEVPLSQRELNRKYGMGAQYSYFVTQVKKWFTPTKKVGKEYVWKCAKKEPFTTSDADMARIELNKWLQHQREGKAVYKNVPHQTPSTEKEEGPCNMTKCTTAQLIAELKRRGYHGTMTLTKEVEF